MNAQPKPDSPIVSRGDLATDLALDAPPGPWRPFLPLDSTPPPPTFPLWTLPRWLAEWAEAVAAAVQAPADLPAMLGLGVLSLAVAPAVELAIRPSWRRPPTLALCIVLDSGAGKSPAFRPALAPVHRHEADRRAAAEPAIREAELDRERLDAQIAAAKRGGKPDALELADLRDQLDAVPVPALPVYVTSDATPEAVVALLAEHRGLGWASPEAELWGNLTGRYGNGPNFDAIMQALDGDALRVHRKTKPPLIVERPALTVVTTAQPVVLERLATLPGDLLRRGLVPRFAFIVPPSFVGRRVPDAPPVPADATERYGAEVGRLLRLRDAQGATPAVLAIRPDALRLFEDWYFAGVEPRLGEGGELCHLAAFASKLRDMVPTTAALLHLADAESLSGEVEAATMERAVAIGRYLLGHACIAWSMMEADESTRAARKLWAFAVKAATWNADHGCRAVTRHDLHARARGTFKRSADIGTPLASLVEHGYLAEVERERNARRSGRPSSPLLLLNPEAVERDPV